MLFLELIHLELHRLYVQLQLLLHPDVTPHITLQLLNHLLVLLRHFPLLCHPPHRRVRGGVQDESIVPGVALLFALGHFFLELLPLLFQPHLQFLLKFHILQVLVVFLLLHVHEDLH
mmetsp:Transcript_8678/g.7976  ORF Transcript_8678/g.7976 Transcript_8678/m.7976 type:complete len:117 (+) Transcript_8678:975-1325(+)